MYTSAVAMVQLTMSWASNSTAPWWHVFSAIKLHTHTPLSSAPFEMDRSMASVGTNLRTNRCFPLPCFPPRRAIYALIEIVLLHSFAFITQFPVFLPHNTYEADGSPGSWTPYGRITNSTRSSPVLAILSSSSPHGVSTWPMLLPRSSTR